MAETLEIGNTTSHEFGHAVGLRHYRSASTQQGSASVIPNGIMATPDIGLNREVWASGTNEISAAQNDVNTIAASLEYAPDGNGDLWSNATQLTPVGGVYSATGVVRGSQVGSNKDVDVFKITVSSLYVYELSVNMDKHSQYVGNLDAKVTVRQKSATDTVPVLVVTLDPADTRGAATILKLLPNVDYFIDVEGHNGVVGDSGAFSLSVSPLPITRMNRILNRNSTPGDPNLYQHVFTTSTNEYNALVAAYVAELARVELGKVVHVPTDSDWYKWNPDQTTGKTGFGVLSSSVIGSTGIYRFYNPNNSQHYFTQNPIEFNILMRIGWIYEKIEGFGFAQQVAGSILVRHQYGDKDITPSVPIYIAESGDLLLSNSGDHIFTADAAENTSLAAKGWREDGSLGYGFLFDSSGNVVFQ
jgi:hypothetical protein